MNTPLNKIQPSDWAFDLFETQDCSGGLAGTGFFISSNYLVTCQHVVEDKTTLYHRRRTSSGTTIILSLNVTGIAMQEDLALLHCNAPISHFPRLLEQKTDETVEKLLNNNSVFYGNGNYDPRTPSKVRVIISRQNSAVQFQGSLDEGHSGGPLVLKYNYYNQFVFGMAQLGGKYAGQSRILPSRNILQFLRHSNVALDPEAASLDEILQAIVFRGDDYRNAIKHNWEKHWC
jgi:hypothetical protein